MYDNILFLGRLTKYLKEATINGTFHEAFCQAKSEIVLQIKKDDGIVSLIFNFNTLPPIFYMRPNFIKAHKNVTTFFKDLKEEKLIDVTIDFFERNIRFHFERYQIVYIYRSKNTNVYLLDSNGIMIASFKKHDKMVGKVFDEEFREKELDLTLYDDPERFNKLMDSFMARQKNRYHLILNSIILIELLTRIRIEPEKTFFDVFIDLRNQFENGDLFIYENFEISIGRFYSKRENFNIESDFFNGIRTAYYEKLKLLGLQSIKFSIDKNIEQKMHKLRSKLANLNSPQVLEDKSELYRLYGNVIIQNFSQINKGDGEFILDDPDPKNRVIIKLNKAKSPVENSDMYFEKAKEEKNRLEATKALIGKFEKEYADLEALKEIVKSSVSMNELKNLKEQFKATKTKVKTQKVTVDPVKSFKKYTIGGGNVVFVGKDSKSNDTLITKFARNEDMWFHVKGSVGSHCILRKNKSVQLSKEVITEAAQIAAFHSKAKTSELVPVSYTERKYVQKKKDMPQGAVTLLREKVIMVQPKLPPRLTDKIEISNE